VKKLIKKAEKLAGMNREGRLAVESTQQGGMELFRIDAPMDRAMIAATQ
jgi:hypothetical protein